jgi:hypothetical protein
MVEVAPPFDSKDITIFASLKLIFEVWGMALIPSRAVTRIAEGHGNR